MPVHIRATSANSEACENLARLTQAVKSLHPYYFFLRKGFQGYNILLGEGPEGLLVCWP